MPATAARAAFIRSEFRSVSIGPVTATVNVYGSKARRTQEPIPTFFVHKEDAEAINTQMMALLGAGHRSVKQTVAGEKHGLDLDYSQKTPKIRVIDSEHKIDAPAIVTGIGIDLDTEETVLESYT
jgi:hypothetical protein